MRGALVVAASLSLLLAASALAAVGGLTQKPGTAGCISETGSAGACVDGNALDNAVSVTISPDGANAYVASVNSNAVAIFDRNTTTGALTQKAGTAGCISETAPPEPASTARPSSAHPRSRSPPTAPTPTSPPS